VHRLPPSQRDAILLVKYEELSYKEAAAVMKVSVSALESLISRALVNLRKFLRE
jgi:RNA polymerase sigma-70 factor (ECF subfamily)